MLATAQSPFSEPAPVSQTVDLVYVRPLGDFRRYEARLLGVASRFPDHVRVTRIRSAELSRFTSEPVFISKTVPTIVLIRDGEVEATGDLPALELDTVLRAATRSAPAA